MRDGRITTARSCMSMSDELENDVVIRLWWRGDEPVRRLDQPPRHHDNSPYCE